MSQIAWEDAPRQACEVRKQMAELLELKRSLSTGPDFGFAGRVSLASINVQEEALREDLRAAELVEFNATADFVLDGEPVHGHDVPAQLLATFLDKVQLLVYAVAQVKAGVATPRARFTQYLALTNKLYVQPQFVLGSFGFRVRVPDKSELGDLIDGDAEDVLLSACRLLGEDIPSEEMMDLLAHSRVKAHYTAIIEMLAKQNANLSMRHRKSSGTMRLASSQARMRGEWLAQVQVMEEVVVRTGELVGGSMERDGFELRTEEGDLLRGKLTTKAKEDLKKLHWGDFVQIRLRVKQTAHEDAIGDATESFIAEQISLAGASDQNVEDV